ncbi:MAG TPA: flagellar basal body rod protein FlgC [Hyphomicrobiaceae bacterium]|nr:flagellar basal body rod protein FlgC [Hyphomicrobiaceae bacterium]
MFDPLRVALKVAGSGIEAQSRRLLVVSENLANAQSTGNAAGADPYARKTVSFVSELDESQGARTVKIDQVGLDRRPFRLEYDPSHPAADANGYVKFPNVDMVVELADMREANRSYEANLQVVKQARSLINMTLDLLRGS